MIAKTIRCEIISWQRVYHLSRKLACLVKESGLQVDTVVAIGRGGYVPARILCDFLDIYQLTSIRVEHYKKGIHREAIARVVDPLSIDITGQQILIVDDVSDSGDTFQIAIEYIAGFHPKEIKTAVMHHKMVSEYVPDYFAQKVIKWRWLTYPWTLMEDLASFMEQMQDRPATVEAMAERLKTDHNITVSRQVLEDAISFSTCN